GLATADTDRVGDDVDAADLDGAVVGRDQPGEDVDGGRLACAVRAEQSHHPAGVDVEVDPPQDGAVAPALDQPSHPDASMHRAPPAVAVVLTCLCPTLFMPYTSFRIYTVLGCSSTTDRPETEQRPEPMADTPDLDLPRGIALAWGVAASPQ